MCQTFASAISSRFFFSAGFIQCGSEYQQQATLNHSHNYDFLILAFWHLYQKPFISNDNRPDVLRHWMLSASIDRRRVSRTRPRYRPRMTVFFVGDSSRTWPARRFSRFCFSLFTRTPISEFCLSSDVAMYQKGGALF